MRPEASIDGVVGPAAEATISVSDEGLLRGDGVFEVMRLYGGRPFGLDQHMRRMATSAGNLRLELDADLMRDEAERLLAAAEPGDGLLRLVATRGGRRIALIEPLPAMAETVRLGYVTYAPTRVLTGVKSLSYAGNMLSSRLARERGFDEALLVTPHGRVLEAPTSTFFWVSGGELLTPPLDDHILASITRHVVMETMGAREAACGQGDVERADEAFLASTIREVQGVAGVEEREIHAPGPVTLEAARRFREHVEASLRSAAAS